MSNSIFQMGTRLLFYCRQFGLSIILVYSGIISVVFLSCNGDEGDISTQLYDQAVAVVKASLGDTLSTSDMMSLIIPPGALTEDGIVFLGRTGSEPKTVPNEDMQVMGTPITIKTPTSIIRKPFKLSIPVGSVPLDMNNFSIFLYNGETYFPAQFSVDASRILVSIDLLNWENRGELGSGIISEIVVLILVNKQTPSEEERGLKKISVDKDRNMTYAEPSASSSSKVLLMVHGWLANSSRWINFMEHINEQKDQLYTEFWTFSYNSSLSIEENADLLFNAVQSHSNGAEIDIVAHSMGGLVSRSMLETFHGDIYINRLVTLSSPHLGSPLAVFRNVFGAIISMENSDNGMLYYYNTQGFKDLDVNSAFIQKMKGLEEPPIPYFNIACTNNAQSIHAKIASEMLEGSDDGIVEVASAKGIARAGTPDTDIWIDTDFAHLEMPNDDLIIEQVMDFLNSTE